MIGILGAEIGGYLWFPAFFETSSNIRILVFDFLTFNIFAALCGADALFLVVLLYSARRPAGPDEASHP